METPSHSHASRAPERPSRPLDEMHEAIRRRAEEIYIRSGKIPGHDVENWKQAEEEILREAGERSRRRTAVVVKVNGMRYVGEYTLDSAAGYKPGEFAAGDPVSVRFDHNKMFVKRRNGRELETTIVKRTQ